MSLVKLRGLNVCQLVASLWFTFVPKENNNFSLF